MENRKGGKLSITTDGAESTIEIEGTGQDLLFNLVVLTHAIAKGFQIPSKLLALRLPALLARYERTGLRESVLMDLSGMKKER